MTERKEWSLFQTCQTLLYRSNFGQRIGFFLPFHGYHLFGGAAYELLIRQLCLYRFKEALVVVEIDLAALRLHPDELEGQLSCARVRVTRKLLR